MKRLSLLLALLLVGAAGPQLLVHVQPQAGTIAGVEYTTGSSPDSQRGSWTLQVLDSSGSPIEEASFDPTIRTGAEPSLLADVYVRVFSPSGASELRLLDGKGAVRDSHALEGGCGDNTCSAGEREWCEQDCVAPEETERAVQNLASPPVPEAGLEGWRAFLIGGAALLIIVLILVLVHLNRKKDNPVEMEYEY